jgi:hypothetical protein
MSTLTDNITFDCKEFPYEEQSELVETHLQMLDGKDELFDQVESELKVEEDEEWSSCESSEDEMES